MAEENKRIFELPVCSTPQGGYSIPVWNTDTERTEQLNLSTLVSSNTSQNFEWISDKDPAYQQDEVVTYGGFWFQSLVNNNVSVPGVDPTQWVQLNKSSSGGFWVAGLYTEDYPYVLSRHNGRIESYELVNPTRPYISTDLVSEIVDGDWQLMGQEIFTSDFTVVLAGGKTFGKYTNGQTVPANNKTAKQVILDAAIEFLSPTFTSFSIFEQSSTVELGTTIPSGSKLFLWATSNGSNISPNTISIEDVDNSIQLSSGASNDGSETINMGYPIPLLSDGDTQTFRIRGTDVNLLDFTRDFVINAKYVRRFGTASSIPEDSNDVRGLSGSTFGNVLNINIPQGQTIICFAYEAGRPDITNSSVKYVEGFNSNVGDTFEQYVFDVNDAAGTPRSYKVYVTVLGAPFLSNATYIVTIP